MRRIHALSASTLLQSLRFSSTEAPKKVLGKQERGVRTTADSFTSMSDIANSPHFSRSMCGQLPAGDILGVMDVCAGNVAQMHCTGSRRFGRDAQGNVATSVCTVAVDHTPFMKPIINGDTFVVEGRAIHAGSSSVGVAVEVYRLQFPTRQKTLVCHSFFTMVAIDDQLKKANVVPALGLSTDRDVLLNEQYVMGLSLARKNPQDRLKDMIRIAESCDGTSPSASCRPIVPNSKSAAILEEAKLFCPDSDLECTPNKLKRYRIPFADTRTEANRVFFPQYLNMNHTIFGGELMRWMEVHAVQCGRMFTANKEVRSLGMYNVEFSDAVNIQDWVTLNAHVVYVHRTTLEVEVEIHVERADKKIVTNKAAFVIANFDEAGQLMEVPNGLDLKGASPGWLARYADSRARYEVGKLTRDRLSDAFNTK